MSHAPALWLRILGFTGSYPSAVVSCSHPGLASSHRSPLTIHSSVKGSEHMCKFLSLLIMFSISFSSWGSVVPIAEYYKYKEEPFMISYVWGVSSGILLAATINSDKGGNKLFCMPTDLVITNEESMSILEQELFDGKGNKRYSGETPVSMVYLFALEKIYPCN